MAANRIFIQVDFQTQSANAAIGALNQNLGSIGTAAQAATAQATQGVKGFSVSVDQAKNAIDSMGQALASLGVARVVQEILTLGDALIRIRLGFDNVRGGAQLWNQLRDVAEATAFSFRDLAENANALRNAGVPIGQIANTLKVLADQAAFAGAGQEALNTAVSKFADIWTRQKITGRELVAFREIGLQPTQILLDKLHISAQRFYEDTRLLNARPVLQNLLQSAQAQSAGAAAARAEQLPSASFTRVRSDVADLARQITEALGPALIGVMKQLRDLLSTIGSLVEAFKSLPEWVRTLAVDLGLLAVAFGAVATAMNLLKLPAFMEVVQAAALAIQALVFGINGGAAAIATIGGAATEAAPAVSGLAASFVTLGTALVAISGFFVGFKIGEWIHEMFTGDEEAAKKAAATVHQQYEFMVQAREKMLSGMTGKDLSAIRTRPLGDYSTAELKTVLDNYNQQIAAIRKTKDTLLLEDEKKAEEANKRGADLLDEARRRNLKVGQESIAALTEEYKVHFRSVAGFAKAEADVRLALELDIATEVKKLEEESRKESIKNIEELSALRRKTAIAAASVTPDDTFAGNKRIAEITGGAYETDIRSHTRLQNQEYDRTHQLQINALEATGGKLSDIAKIEKEMADNRVQQNAIADEKVKLHRLEMERDLNQLIEEQRKQLAEQDLQDQIDTIEQAKTLRVAVLGATTADSLPQRLQQIREITQAQIEATQQARDARIDAARGELEHYRSQNPNNQAGIDEEQAKFEHTRMTTAHAAEVQIQLDRINLWKESNDAIIAEQKQVYEGIKSALDKVWDALLNRSQSVWSAIGNALKTAVLNAMKEIVTSRLAASIAEMFGYGTYSFKRGIAGITEPPSPSGLGGGPPVAAIASVTSGLILPGGAPGGATGGGGGGPAAYVTGEVGQYVRAAQTEAATQADTARMQQPGGATSGGYTGGGYSGGYSVAPWAAPSTALGQATMASGSSSGAPPAATGGGMQMQQSIQRLRSSLNIGKPIISDTDTVDALGNAIPAGTAIPWANATAGQRLDTVLHSQGVATLGMTLGGAMVLSGLRRAKTALGTAQIFGGAAMAGAGAASMFPGLGLSMAGGALLGVGVGSLAYGLARGGKVGLGFDIAGGALTGALLGTALFPGIGTLAGAVIGAGVGAMAGIVRMFSPTLDERVRSEVKRVYGIDIPNAAIRKQIVDLTNQKYGGNLSIALYSSDVQDLVRLYAISTGQSTAGLPRPMYSATFAQSQAGGLQLQPVYSNGQLISNPYVGTTSTQLQQSLYANPAIYMQLHPQQAADLFSGQVVRVIGNNPAAVAQANAAATRTGTTRLAQGSALMEPMTVTQ